jgi:hypothetical protein
MNQRLMDKTLSEQIAKNPTQFNIAAIAKLEEEALDRRTRTERESDAIVRFIGSPVFLLLHVILVVVWSTRVSARPPTCTSWPPNSKKNFPSNSQRWPPTAYASLLRQVPYCIR